MDMNKDISSKLKINQSSIDSKYLLIENTIIHVQSNVYTN